MSEKLVTFLYLLMRDDVTTGRVERILEDVRKTQGSGKVVYSARYLEEYARELAAELWK